MVKIVDVFPSSNPCTLSGNTKFENVDNFKIEFPITASTVGHLLCTVDRYRMKYYVGEKTFAASILSRKIFKVKDVNFHASPPSALLCRNSLSPANLLQFSVNRSEKVSQTHTR